MHAVVWDVRSLIPWRMVLWRMALTQDKRRVTDPRAIAYPTKT
ncbi:hypothetical protein [Coleofasciculus sp. FACHB-SPT9]|nr:hypothetical protein [Coleofasciculus sp. FACHB-SPT9]